MAMRRAPRPQYEWENTRDILTNQAIPAKLLGGGAFTAGLPLTVRRLRGRISAVLNAGAVDEHWLIHVGVCKVSGDAFAAGSGSVPGPVTDRDQDWLWTGVLFVSSLEEASIQPQFLADSIMVDSKAMRRMKTNEVLAVVFEAVTSDSQDQAGDLTVQYSLDVLVST